MQIDVDCDNVNGMYCNNFYRFIYHEITMIKIYSFLFSLKKLKIY